MIVKQAMENEARKQQQQGKPMVGLIGSIAANVSERADTRSWSLLPGNIQMARLSLPVGKHDVTATYYGANGNVIGTREFKGVEIKSKRAFISDYFMNPPVPPKAAN